MIHEISRFLAPRETISAIGGSDRLIHALRDWGLQSGNVLLVCDKVVHDLGVNKAYIEALNANGFSVTVFAEIAGEPTDTLIEAAVAAGRQAAPDLVVGFGGGSALDTAKLVAYTVNSGVGIESLRGEVPSIENFPPLVLIPTTTGTGSEATRVAMYSRDGLKTAVVCNQFVPTIALLDAELVANLPKGVVAATSLDALSHSIESMMSTNNNHLTKTMSTQAARIIFRALPVAYHGGSVEARGELLYASYLAGLSLNAAVVLGHSMSYSIAARQNLSHGAGCALALPYCIAYNEGVNPALDQEISASVLAEPTSTLRDVAFAVQTLTANVGLPTSLEEIGMPQSLESEVAAEIVESFPRPNNPVPLDVTKLETLLGHMRHGNLAEAFN